MAFISSEHKKRMYKSERMAIIGVLAIVVVLIIALIIGLGGGGKNRNDDPSKDNLSTDAVASGDTSYDSSKDPVSVDSGIGAVTQIDFVSVKVDNSKIDDGFLVLVNKDHKFDKNVESSLIDVYEKFDTEFFSYSNSGLLLNETVANKLSEMCAAFTKATENSNLMLHSAYISKEKQQQSYDEKAADASPEELMYLQPGGCSEHQTGLAFDLMAYPAKNGEEMGVDQYAWFIDHCWEHGFIVRYPNGKENVTFIKNDTDQFRYVGVPHALYMHRYSLTLEEYVEYLQTRTYESRLMLDDGSSDKYQVYACKASEGSQTEIMVPAENSGWKYDISGTNDGYFIVTIYNSK